MAWLAWFTMRGHLPYIRHPGQHSADEGYLLAVGMRMLQGHMLPYVDGVAHTGPLFLYSGALLAAFGPFSWVPVRVVAGVTYALMPVLLFAVGREARRPLAGALAGLPIPIYTLLRWWPTDGIAYNAETPVILCTLGALFCMLRGVWRTDREASSAWCAAAGAFTVGIALSKQVGALQALVVGLGFLVALFARDGLTFKRRLVLLAYFGAAALLPAVALVGWLALHGALKDAYFYLVTYNREVYMFHLRNEEVPKLWRAWLEGASMEVTLLIGALSWGLAQGVIAQAGSSRWREMARGALFPLLMTGLTATGIIGARASQRDFAHYYLMAMPWIGMLLGMIVEQSLARARAGWLAFAARVVLLLPIWYAVELVWDTRGDQLHGWSDQVHNLVPVAIHDQMPRACTLVRAHSTRADKLFVWGFRPELYVSCKRWPASRFVFTTFVSGFVPWNYASSREEENSLAVPGSRALLISELEATKPPVIVDAPLSMGGRSMTWYPETNAYLLEHYKLLSSEFDAAVWLRNGS
jgi:hypothetical protein